jgi:small-conductance mechanosensitive channel
MSALEDFLNWTIPYLNMTVGEFIIALILTLIIAVVLFVVVLRLVRRSLERAKVPPLLTDLFVRITKMALGLVVLITFMSLIGFDVSSLVIASAAIIGLVLAFGMSETINNFINGIMIAVNRPIEKGEYVTVTGMEGTVEQVEMMYTRLITLDNKLIVIPNGKVWGEPIVNMSRLGIRRLEIDVGIPYDSDFGTAMESLITMMKHHPKVLKDPEPTIFMKELDDSSVVIQLWPWVDSSEYYPVTHDIRLAVVDTLAEVGIIVPFPQLDLHLKDTPHGAAVTV